MNGQDPNQPQQQPSGYFPMPMPQENLASEVLNKDELIESIEHRLRGERKINEEWFLPEGSKPRMNEQGISDLTSEIDMFVDKNWFLTNLSEEDIGFVMSKLHKLLAGKLRDKWKDYGIEKSQLSNILWFILFNVMPALRRPLKEGERGFLQPMVSIGQYTQPQPQKKKRFRLFGRGRSE